MDAVDAAFKRQNPLLQIPELKLYLSFRGLAGVNGVILIYIQFFE